MKCLKILLFLLLCSINNKISAQEIEWQNTIGGSGIDQLYSITQTNDGGYILGGFSDSPISGDKTEDSQPNNWDYWVVKLDASGNIQWQNTISGDQWDRIFDVAATSDGGCIVGGYSSSNISGDKTENSNGLEDYWVIKLDSVGGIQWQNTIGGSSYDYFNSISQTSDGGYILGGSSDSPVSGDKTEGCIGQWDYWIIKLDASGNIQWQNTIGGSEQDQFFSISQTTDNGYIVCGGSYSPISGDKTEDSQTGDFWVIKLSPFGSIIWQNSIGGNGQDLARSILQTSDGGYLVGGDSNSNISGDKTENSQGSTDYWVLKLDNLGNILWQNTIGGSNSDRLYNITQTSDGGYLLGGFSNSGLSGDKTENNFGGNDYWLVKIDNTGNILWQNNIGADLNDQLLQVKYTSDSCFILAGYSDSNLSGDKTENSNGDKDYWVMKITDNFNLIKGLEYADLNSNNIKESSESPLVYKKILETNTGPFSFTDQNGSYQITVLDTGNFIVTPELIPNYYTASPVNYNINFSSYLQTDSLNDFAMQPTGSFADLCITITPTGPFRSSMNASYLVNYNNVGTITIPNVMMVFYPDTNVSYASATVTPSSITTDSVVLSIGSLSPYQYGQILITVSVDAGLLNGTIINSGVTIFPIAGDVNPSCNMDAWVDAVTGSFDPNDILVSRSFLYDTEIINQPDLEYIIRFQNTGNDTAFTVKVLNPIDTNRLQLNSIEIVSASHTMNASWIPWERNMQFQFDNILLPDSNINEAMSHGFIRYKIKPNTNLQVGDSINNMAAIYFDYNSPILTNSAKTDIILFTGNNEPPNSSVNFDLYPNPSSTQIFVRFKSDAPIYKSLELYSVYGQKIQTFEIGNGSGTNFVKSIDISKLTSGVYFLKLKGNSSIAKRFVKF